MAIFSEVGEPVQAPRVSLDGSDQAVSFTSEDLPDVDQRIAHLVGKGKRVLVLAADRDSLAEALRNNDCQVTVEPIIVAGTTQPDLDDAVADNRFDAIVAAEALEYLGNPRLVLERLKQFLQPGGFVVSVVPNVAHGSIRLALLAGRFPAFRGRGHERLCQHHFTRDSLVRLLESAGYAIGYLERHEIAIEPSDTLFDETACAEELRAALGRDPDARTARFVCVAIPMPWPGMHWLQHRLRQLSEQRECAERDARELRADLETVNTHLSKLLRVQEDSLAREKDLRARLLDAHHRLAARERDIHEAAGRLAQLEGRLDRFRRSVPGRAYRFARGLVRRLVD